MERGLLIHKITSNISFISFMRLNCTIRPRELHCNRRSSSRMRIVRWERERVELAGRHGKTAVLWKSDVLGVHWCKFHPALSAGRDRSVFLLRVFPPWEMNSRFALMSKRSAHGQRASPKQAQSSMACPKSTLFRNTFTSESASRSVFQRVDVPPMSLCG